MKNLIRMFGLLLISSLILTTSVNAQDKASTKKAKKACCAQSSKCETAKKECTEAKAECKENKAECKDAKVKCDHAKKECADTKKEVKKEEVKKK